MHKLTVCMVLPSLASVYAGEGFFVPEYKKACT